MKIIRKDSKMKDKMRRMALVAVAVSAVGAHAQFMSVPGPDAGDMWMRSQLMNMGTPSGDTASYGGEPSLDDTFAMMNACVAAIDNQNWERALDKIIDYLNATRSSSLEPDVNRAANFLTASMLCWNTDRIGKAKEFLDKAISLMRNGSNLGGGCESRAVAFRRKMNSGDLPSIFSSKDIQGPCGIHSYVMEIPHATSSRNIRATMARYEAIGRMVDAQKGIYETSGRWFEKSSKFYASQEYQNATRRTFDPDRPPERGTSAREHWDSAKRIYDIFGR